MSNRLSEYDIEVILRCIRLILESDVLYPEEIATRLGVNAQTLQRVATALPHLVGIPAGKHPGELAGVPFADFSLAIHNSLVEVAYGITLEEATLQSRYNLSRPEVEAVLNKWSIFEDSP